MGFHLSSRDELLRLDQFIKIVILTGNFNVVHSFSFLKLVKKLA